MMLRRMGKLIEELGELSNVAARCIIQGIDEVDPGTGKANRLRLEHEIADVMAQCSVTMNTLQLNVSSINARTLDKIGQMAEWELMFVNNVEVKQPAKTRCLVRGHLMSDRRGMGMCAHATTGGEFCGFTGHCINKVEES